MLYTAQKFSLHRLFRVVVCTLRQKPKWKQVFSDEFYKPIRTQKNNPKISLEFHRTNHELYFATVAVIISAFL